MTYKEAWRKLEAELKIQHEFTRNYIDKRDRLAAENAELKHQWQDGHDAHMQDLKLLEGALKREAELKRKLEERQKYIDTLPFSPFSSRAPRPGEIFDLPPRTPDQRDPEDQA